MIGTVLRKNNLKIDAKTKRRYPSGYIHCKHLILKTTLQSNLNV